MLRSSAIFFAITVAILLPGPAPADIVSAAEGTAAVDSATALPLELGEEFFSKLDARNCTELKETAYREISRFVLNDRPDLLHEFVLYWRDRCLTPEPLFRILILGSIWDAGFNAVMITDTAFFRNPNYHTWRDTMETLDFEYMAQLVESLMLFFTGFPKR